MTASDRVFAAVFPPIEFDIPTPRLGSSGFEESFGSPFVPEPAPLTGAAEQIKWDRAWHTATTYLSLPKVLITAAHASQGDDALEQTWVKPYTPEVSRAVYYVISEKSYGHLLRRGTDRENLLRWYVEEMAIRHYLDCVRPSLINALLKKDAHTALSELVQILSVAQAIYLYPLGNVLKLLPNGGEEELLRTKSNFHWLFLYSLSQSGYTQHLTNFLKQKAFIILGINEAGIELAGERQMTLGAIKTLHDVGLGGAMAQRLFAEVMNNVLTRYIRSAFAGNWTSPSTITEQLRDWIENHFARFVVEILDCLKEKIDLADELTNVTHADVERWQVMGINQLGALRTDELFDIVVDWDTNSRGGIEDLKRYITNTSARSHVTASFSNALTQRLLQPAASTAEILQFYISVIRAFAILDPKGVLLDRIAQPIRRYLSEREDTATIIINGLLADPNNPKHSGSDVLFELAVEMDKTANLKGENELGDAELDWDDMSWMPDPVDAGPEYKKSKQSDVIGSLISLFETKDIFVKQFQNSLGERLLKKEYDFDKEIRVLELLKLRFGEPALQACAVMLRDILDSRHVDKTIRTYHKLNMDMNAQPAPELHTRILSRLFWPSLFSDTFFIPPEIESLQERYSAGFESLKQSRKLTWLQALGQVTVELVLEDRRITEEVQTWQASVIYAFQSGSSTPVVKTVPQLMQELSMSEALVRNALVFWVGKLVLKESSPSAFTVLDTITGLSKETGTSVHTTIAAAADAAASAAAIPVPAAVRSNEGGGGAAKESMALFWQYSVGMLTNQGPMPLQQIVAYLGVFVPGGFPFGNETMRELLDKKVQEGALEVVGSNYKILT